MEVTDDELSHWEGGSQPLSDDELSDISRRKVLFQGFVGDNTSEDSCAPQLRTCIVRVTFNSNGKTFEFSWDTAPQLPLDVISGQEGFVLESVYVDTKDRRWRKFALSRSGKSGWVLESCLELGQIHGQCKLVDQTVGAIHLREESNMQGSVLEKTLFKLHSGMIEAQEKFYRIGAPRSAFSVLVDHGAQIRKYLLDGMPTKLRTYMNDGKCTFDQLWGLPSDKTHAVTNRNDKRKLLYILLFKDLPHGENGKYGGKSIIAGKRWAQHNTYLKPSSNKSGQMYARGRRAGSWKMIVFTDLSAVPIEYLHMSLRVIEQTLVCLLHSATPILLDDSLDDTEQIAKYYFDRAAARLFSELSNQVFVQTGWQGVKACGMNWTSPMSEILLMHTAWTCQEVPFDHEDGSTMRVYRRAPLKAMNAGTGVVEVILISGGGDKRGQVAIVVPKEANIPKDIHLYPVVEVVMGENRRHPVPYARVPEPGPFSDWKYLNRIGIRLEWQEGDTWKSIWIQSAHIFEPPDMDQEEIDACGSAFQHLSKAYIRTQCLINTLMQVRYPEDAELPNWIKKGPEIVVKSFHYDHLTQTIIVKDQVPTYREVPTMRSFEENEIDLHYMYGIVQGSDISNLIVGNRPISGLGTRAGDQIIVCAMCTRVRVPGAFSRENKPDVDAEGNNLPECPTRPAVTIGPPSELREASCRRCFWLRRPCVWVPLVDLANNVRFKFIRVPHAWEGVAQIVEGPSREHVLEIGPTEEELEPAGEEL